LLLALVGMAPAVAEMLADLITREKQRAWRIEGNRTFDGIIFAFIILFIEKFSSILRLIGHYYILKS